jgi:hypothetical protein
MTCATLIAQRRVTIHTSWMILTASPTYPRSRPVRASRLGAGSLRRTRSPPAVMPQAQELKARLPRRQRTVCYSSHAGSSITSRLGHHPHWVCTLCATILRRLHPASVLPGAVAAPSCSALATFDELRHRSGSLSRCCLTALGPAQRPERRERRPSASPRRIWPFAPVLRGSLAIGSQRGRDNG